MSASAASTQASSPARTPVSEQPLSLWEKLTTVRTNPVNLKCTTLPILSLRSQYSRNFHLYNTALAPRQGFR
jgi:hypothetical protein